MQEKAFPDSFNCILFIRSFEHAGIVGKARENTVSLQNVKRASITEVIPLAFQYHYHILYIIVNLTRFTDFRSHSYVKYELAFYSLSKCCP